MKKINQRKYIEALKWIVKILNDNKIKFNVSGGLAAYVYGSKRMLVDIDISMSYRDMLKLTKITNEYVIEKPWKLSGINSNWKCYYMELNYKGISIEMGEAKKAEFFNKQSNKWEKFQEGLENSVKKRIFGIIIPVMPKKNLIDYKSKLNRKVDIIDLKNMGK